MWDWVSIRAAAKLDPGAAAKHDPGTLIMLSVILVLTGWETWGTILTAVDTAERERERDMTVLEETSAATASDPTGYSFTLYRSDVRTFARIIGNIGRAVSSDVQRGLDCVKIHRDQDTIIMEACDSYRAVVVSFPVNHGVILPRLWNDPLYVNGKQLVKAAKMIGRKTDSVTVSVSDHTVTVESDMGSAKVDRTITIWPASLGTVIASAREDHYPCGDQQMEAPIDAALLSDLLSIIAKISGATQPKVRLSGVGQKADRDRPTGAWRWIAEQDDVTVEAVIMGLR